MSANDLYNLRFPIGEFSPQNSYTKEDTEQNISTIARFPEKLREAVSFLNDERLNTPYREGGWTVRQVIHHLADSHINSYCRFKLTLTEDTPTIKPYYEDHWAELPEARSAPAELSLHLLDALHKRWTLMLQNITADQIKRKFHHPETNKDIALDELIHLYAWHCEHHLAHITELKKRNGWV